MTSQKTIYLDIEGMTCTACSSSIERALKRNKNIENAEVYLLDKSSKITFNSEAVSEEDIIKTIKKLGYEAYSKNSTQNNTQTKIKQKELNNLSKINCLVKLINYKLSEYNRMIYSAILTVIIMTISMSHMIGINLPNFLSNPQNSAIIQLIIVLIVMHIGRNFFINGIKALINRIPNMDSLVALGSLSGFFYSVYLVLFKFNSLDQEHLYFEGVCTILTFIMIGKYIEYKAKNNALKHANSLLNRKEESSFRVILKNNLEDLQNAQLEKIDSKDIMIGDIVKIHPHSSIPVDGIILSDGGKIDESMLSGESIPVEKKINDKLFSGTLNGDCVIFMKATEIAKNSTLSKIESLVSKSLKSKAQIAQLADKISLYFVPGVIFLAICSFIFWWIAKDFETALIFFATTLLISCPCAFGLATPMAVLFSNAKANKMGIFFKNAQSLENASKAHIMLFDKTGTLTKKNLGISKIYNFSNFTDNEIIEIAQKVEEESSHIVAKAISAYKNLNPNKIKIEIIESKTISEGIICKIKINNETNIIKIGSYKMFSSDLIAPHDIKQEGILVYISLKAQSNIEDMKLKNANEERLIGALILIDELKDDALYSVQELKNMGFEIKILSGDNVQNVERIAKILKVEFKGNCTPEDKLNIVQEYQKMGKKTIMIGDGANDAAALSNSLVSIALANGSNVSMEYSDIVIFESKKNNDDINLDSVLKSIKISKNTLNIIKQNLGFAFLYNIICIPIAMGFLTPIGINLNPMFAALAMSLSSISVVLSSMRLYYFKVN